MIHLLFLDLKATIFSSTDQCSNVKSKGYENLEETFKELKYGDLNTTAKVTYAKWIKEEKIARPTVFCVSVDVHNSFPAEDGKKSPNQLKLKNAQFVRNKIEKAQKVKKCDKRLASEKQNKIFEIRKKVNFCDAVQIKYYEKDSSDES